MHQSLSSVWSVVYATELGVVMCPAASRRCMGTHVTHSPDSRGMSQWVAVALTGNKLLNVQLCMLHLGERMQCWEFEHCTENPLSTK